jgi:hypothetical protein
MVRGNRADGQEAVPRGDNPVSEVRTSLEIRSRTIAELD